MTDRADAGVESNGDSEQAAKALVLPGDVLPLALHVLPLHERPIFPYHTLPLILPEDPWAETLVEAGQTPQKAIGLIMVVDPENGPLSAAELHRVGTVARIRQAARGNGQIQLIVEALQRFRVLRWISESPPLSARVEYLDEEHHVDDTEAKAYALAIMATIKELLPLNPLMSQELKIHLDRFTPSQPSALVYFAANLTSASRDALQEILEIPALHERMVRVLELLKKDLDVAKLQVKIREQVEQKMTEQQRRFFLREQLKVIQKELGIEKDDRTAETDEFRRRLESKTPSEEARKRIEAEMDKFSVLEQGSPEYAVTRNYLDWMTNLPWGVSSDDQLDLVRAREVLDADHTGLNDLKERIIEFLAVGRLRGRVSGSIILLVGPPGVGKTSIGRSIAAALGRQFFRFSLGGMRDEAEIKGHRRTYIGSMPGKFIQALSDVEVANPVLMLDEIDKIGASYQGDPASALLEVLDPEQNQSFLDHYIDVRFNLSRVLFVCTANQLDTIPGPLLDRMEVMRLSGYITEEKVEIARNHLVPRLLERAGLRRRDLSITDPAIRLTVEGYAREAGVRGLEKRINQIVRKAAVRIAKGERGKVRVSARNLTDFLGEPVFSSDHSISGVGVITGLAWTPLGGAVLPIEAAEIHLPTNGLRLTGQLGDVMRESAEIAFSHVAAHAVAFGLRKGFFEHAFVHLHVPEGATPKDGPSAGITMATALISLGRGRRAPPGLAMTGELTLTGRVLPVGGIREKVIAARRSRLRTLIMPERNRRDFNELPDYLREGLSVHFVTRFRDVVQLVFNDD